MALQLSTALPKRSGLLIHSPPAATKPRPVLAAQRRGSEIIASVFAAQTPKKCEGSIRAPFCSLLTPSCTAEGQQ